MSYILIPFGLLVSLLSVRLKGEQALKCRFVCRAEKFVIVSNDQRQTQKSDFSVLDQKYL